MYALISICTMKQISETSVKMFHKFKVLKDIGIKVPQKQVKNLCGI